MPSLSIPLPRSFDDSFAIAHKSGALYRLRTSKKGEIYPGCWTGKKTSVLQAHLLAELAREFGSDQLDRFSMASAVTQQLPDYTGLLAPVDRAGMKIGALHGKVIRLIRHFARRVWPLQKEAGLTVPRKSSVGWPWFVTGDEGALVRQMLLQDYLKNGTELADLWAAGDTEALAEGGRFISEVALAATSLRLQPRNGKWVMRGGVPVGFTTKDRPLQTFDGESVLMTVKAPAEFGPLASVMRSRQVAAHSATSNLLGQILWTRHRAGIYAEFPVFHPTDISASIKVVKEMLQWPELVDATYDFATMDKTQLPEQYDAILKGFKDAGAPDAFLNIHRANLFSAVIHTQDCTKPGTRPGYRVEGSVLKPLVYPHDVGHHSGHFATDTDNAQTGSMTYFVGLNESKQYAKYYDLDSDDGCESFLDEVVMRNLRYQPVPGCRAYMVINKGDDCYIVYKDKHAARAAAQLFEAFAPVWSITQEERTQILGRDVVGDSTLPFIDKAPANFCSPERFCTDKMKEFWMLGVPARDVYYGEHPDWPAVKSAIITAFTVAYGTDPFQLAARATPPNAPAPQNAAELECLWNPEAVTYKFAPQDVRTDFAEALGYYTTITVEQVDAICRQFT